MSSLMFNPATVNLCLTKLLLWHCTIFPLIDLCETSFENAFYKFPFSLINSKLLLIGTISFYFDNVSFIFFGPNGHIVTIWWISQKWPNLDSFAGSFDIFEHIFSKTKSLVACLIMTF